MMYFSRMKTTLILGACLLGMLLGVPNLFPSPAQWLPWRSVHLGLDLRGGSYLLLEVDMKAVLKERLESLADGVRQALRNAQIFYQTLEPQPDQNRVLLRLRDATKTDAAVAAMKPLISQDASTGRPDTVIGSDPDGTITLTLSAPALAARAAGAVDQSIEIVRRRIDEAGVVDPQITRPGQSRRGGFDPRRRRPSSRPRRSCSPSRARSPRSSAPSGRASRRIRPAPGTSRTTTRSSSSRAASASRSAGGSTSGSRGRSS